MNLEECKNKILNMDCLEFMSQVPDKYFDLIITDPPYGINISSNPIRQKHTKKDWDNEIPIEKIFKQIFRVSKNQIIWGANYFNLPPSKCFLIWDKKQPYDFSLAMAELAFCSFDYPAKIYSHSNRGDESKIHPTQKPTKLIDFCLNFAQEREIIKTVYDPFMGSGTTGEVCKSSNIDFWGTELDPEYCELANKRLKQIQAKLF